MFIYKLNADIYLDLKKIFCHKIYLARKCQQFLMYHYLLKKYYYAIFFVQFLMSTTVVGPPFF